MPRRIDHLSNRTHDDAVPDPGYRVPHGGRDHPVSNQAHLVPDRANSLPVSTGDNPMSNLGYHLPAERH
jgi:hypothetical protein